MRLRNNIIAFLIVLVTALALPAYADQSSPVAMLQQISNRMISELKAKKLELKHNRTAVHAMVRTILIPHVDMQTLSHAVLRSYWGKASQVQREEFMQRFTSILVNTYASALAAYNNETVVFMPVRGGYHSRTMVRVDSRIIRKGANAIPVSYRLRWVGSRWKVYDLIVDGVSLAQSYRSQFASILDGQGGMDTLLRTMAQHHGKNERAG